MAKANMIKRQHRNKNCRSKDNPEESYLIKIPVHLAFMYDENDTLFFSNKQELIDFVKNKVNAYQEPVVSRTRNKTKTTVISSIKYEEVSICQTPALILTVEAYDTNISGKYLEGNSRVDIISSHRIGSDNNKFLVYPVIKGLSETSHNCSILLLSYETPNKDGAEMTKLARLLIKKVLELSGVSLKPPHIIDELKKASRFQEVTMRLSSLSIDENDVDLSLREFYTSGKTSSTSLKTFKNVPSQLIFDQLEKKKIELNENHYLLQETVFVIGKHTYKLRKELSEDINEWQESAEKIFNAGVPISKDELENKIDEDDFMISKFNEVLTNYFSYGEI